MEYSAGNVSNLLWFVETRETMRLLNTDSVDNVMNRVIDENVYQQKDLKRAKRQFNVIRKRLEALPESLATMIVSSDISTAKLLVFISCMATDRLLFELVYEVYREKLFLGEKDLSDADLNIFFKNKKDQSDKVAGMSGASIISLLHNICKEQKKTVIIVTHNKAISVIADRIIKVQDGEIVSNLRILNPKKVEDIER